METASQTTATFVAETLLARFIRVSCDADHKALCAQFVGETQGPELPLKSGDQQSWRAAHVIERNGTRRGRPIYSPAYAANGSALLALLPAAAVPASPVTIAFALDRIERRAGRAAVVTQLVLVMLIVDEALLLMRKLHINGAGLTWFGSCYKYFGDRAAQNRTQHLPSACHYLVYLRSRLLPEGWR